VNRDVALPISAEIDMESRIDILQREYALPSTGMSTVSGRKYAEAYHPICSGVWNSASRTGKSVAIITGRLL
jgi:hypothetical protein